MRTYASSRIIEDSNENRSLIFQEKRTKFASDDEIFVKKVISLIQQNIDNEHFGVPSLAEHMHLSVSQLTRKLKLFLKTSPGKLIRELRLRYAAQLLLYKGGTIVDIAYQVGFSDQAHFCRSFKRLFDCSPSEYKKRNGKKEVTIDFLELNFLRQNGKDLH